MTEPTRHGETDAVSALEHLGLTSYEAKVFIALQKLGSGTARDVHRVADVPRSQVYAAAESLEERGLIEVQQSNPIQYRPVSIEEARSTLRERFEREQDRAFDYVEDVRRKVDADGEEQEDIWTVRGAEHVADRAASLIHDATEWVVYSARTPAQVTDEVIAALRDAAERGVDVAVLGESEAVRDVFADVPGVVVRESGHHQHHAHDDKSGQAVFADDDVILLSVLGQEEVPGINRETAFWSAHTNFASVLIQLIQAREETPDI